MFSLTIEDKTYVCDTEETVLDALLRQNVNIPFASKKGTCHSCMIRCLAHGITDYDPA